jgi:hypothetical protein
MPRYAVIRALDANALPIGLVIEDEGCVRVEALDEYALPERISEPYRVLQRDLSEVLYTPGDSGYFDQVLVELSRHASVGERGKIPFPSEAALLNLFSEKVLKPRLRQAIRGSYRGPSQESVFQPRFHRIRRRQPRDGECIDQSPAQAAYRVAA